MISAAWRDRFSVQSNYAREHAQAVAAAASQGLITTINDQLHAGTRWLVTQRGLRLLWKERMTQ